MARPRASSSITPELISAVLFSPELLNLILEKLVHAVRTLGGAHDVLRLLSVCHAWNRAPTVRVALAQHWSLACHAVLSDGGHPGDVVREVCPFVQSSHPEDVGIAFFHVEESESTSTSEYLPYGLPELLDELTGASPDLFHTGGDVNYIVQVDGASYAARCDGGTYRFDGGPHRPHHASHAWEMSRGALEEDVYPHNGLAVALGCCFVSDCHVEGKGRVVALDAHDLTQRFSFGQGELINPLGLAWRDGLLWVADGGHPSAQGDGKGKGKLVAYSFHSPGPRCAHIIEGVDMPVGIAAAHGHLYVVCRDEACLHVLRVEEHLAQGARSALGGVPHTTHRLPKTRPRTKLYELVVHPKLPVAVVNAGEGLIAVFWSGEALGCKNYHDIYQIVSSNEAPTDPDAGSDGESNDEASNDGSSGSSDESSSEVSEGDTDGEESEDDDGSSGGSDEYSSSEVSEGDPDAD